MHLENEFNENLWGFLYVDYVILIKISPLDLLVKQQTSQWCRMQVFSNHFIRLFFLKIDCKIAFRSAPFN